MESLGVILSRYLEKYAPKGKGLSANGATQFGRAPGVGTHAWVHSALPPLRPEQESQLRAGLGDFVHSDILRVLRIHNGFNMFCGHLSLYGVQEPLLTRSPDFVHPFSIQSENHSWPWAVRNGCLFVGGVGHDGDHLCMNSRTGAVHLVPQRGGVAIEEFESLRIALLTLCERLDAERDWTQWEPPWKRSL